MTNKTFRYTALALNLLEKFLGTNFSVTGIENLPKQPIMFVANHFTRVETFIVPYLIYKYSGKQVKCLADSSLYHGSLGRFLNSVGALSTKDKNRDKIIIQDLISGQFNWMIYPEGNMLKSKKIKNKGSFYGGFVGLTSQGEERIRTGSAVLALKSQIYRNDIIDAYDNNNADILNYFKKDFDISYSNSLRDLNTQIVPLNITYYPLRPGDNKIKQIASRLVKNMPKRLAEELEIEGNLLLGGEINIHFGNPIDLSQYIKTKKSIIYQIPIIKQETKSNLIINYFRTHLTNNFMEKIYSDVQINFDHIFASILALYDGSEIEIDHLKRIIYLSGLMIAERKKYRLNKSLLEGNLIKMFIDEEFEEFDSIFNLAKSQGVIENITNKRIKIKKDILLDGYDFHTIRIENSLQVIANEFSMLDVASNIVKRNVKISDDDLKERVFREIYRCDIKIFNDDYERFYDENFSKEKSVGSPFFLNSTKLNICSKEDLNCDSNDLKFKPKIGILLCHGYKSSPKEVEALAKFLNNLGFAIYVTRMGGHGTAPINMEYISWEKDWYYNVQRGYAALKNITDKIIIIGFSTGGLLALLSAARKNNSNSNLFGIISINSALRLLDIRARMVPGINIWNEMLKKFHIDKGRFEYVDDIPEHPDVNYSRNYLKGVEQLGNLMSICEKNLAKVKVSALIIQGKKDPIVNPVSGELIYDKIGSKNKEFVTLDFSNHVIVNGDRKEEVFNVIKKYLVNLLTN